MPERLRMQPFELLFHENRRWVGTKLLKNSLFRVLINLNQKKYLNETIFHPGDPQIYDSPLGQEKRTKMREKQK